jgi:hypothetical protein
MIGINPKDCDYGIVPGFNGDAISITFNKEQAEKLNEILASLPVGGVPPEIARNLWQLSSEADRGLPRLKFS